MGKNTVCVKRFQKKNQMFFLPHLGKKKFRFERTPCLVIARFKSRD